MGELTFLNKLINVFCEIRFDIRGAGCSGPNSAYRSTKCLILTTPPRYCPPSSSALHSQVLYRGTSLVRNSSLHRTPGIVLLWGPKRGVFLMSEVPLHSFERSVAYLDGRDILSWQKPCGTFAARSETSSVCFCFLVFYARMQNVQQMVGRKCRCGNFYCLYHARRGHRTM